MVSHLCINNVINAYGMVVRVLYVNLWLSISGNASSLMRTSIVPGKVLTTMEAGKEYD